MKPDVQNAAAGQAGAEPGVLLPRRGGKAAYAAATELAIVFMGSTLLTPLYPLYRRAFGFSELTLTLIYAAYAVGNLAALLILGRLSDEVGRKQSMRPARLGAAISAVVYIAAAGPTWLFAGRCLSGLAIGLASGTATAWIADLTPGQDRHRASLIAASANFAGIAFGPLLAGVLARYGPEPLHLSFGVYLLLLVAGASLAARIPETVAAPVRKWRRLALRPRLGVPKGIRAAFIAPAATAFALFGLIGFYAALLPLLLQRDLRQSSPAVQGAVVALMFFAGLAAVGLTRRATSRRTMLASLAGLPIALALLVGADRARSLPILLAGAVEGGFVAALGYRGSLEVVNQIAPAERRAEIVSTYLVMCFLGNSLPVVGVGVLSTLTSPAAADLTFAIVIAAIALGALGLGLKFAPPAPGSHANT